jgi:hypothetical protein
VVWSLNRLARWRPSCYPSKVKPKVSPNEISGNFAKIGSFRVNIKILPLVRGIF